MRPNVVAAMVTLVGVILTSCGLAIAATKALAPDEVAARPAIAVEQRAAPAPAAAAPAAVPAITSSAAALPLQPALEIKAAPQSADVGSMKHVWQSLNNCGPAAVVMALSTLGVDVSQEAARLALRGTDERRGMGPGPVAPWVEKEFGLRSMSRSNGTHALLKRLVANGFAPMVTQWLEDPGRSRISHWRTVRGYDDAKAAFTVNDPMLGNAFRLSYAQFQDHWQPFGYRYMVVYRPEQEPVLKAVVGQDWYDPAMRRNWYERARMEADTQRTAWSWLALGEAAYQNGRYAEAVEAIEKGMALGSATGVFMLRSSYPNALRALGRHAEAAAAQTRLSNLTPGVTPAAGSSAPLPRPDPAVVAAIEARERQARFEWLMTLPLEQRPTA